MEISLNGNEQMKSEINLKFNVTKEMPTILTEGSGTFSIQIPDCQVNAKENLFIDNLKLSTENLKYLNISSILLPKKNEKEFIFKMESGFDYDKVHQLNCSKPGLYLTTYRNLKFTLKEPKNFNVQMASSLGLLSFTRLTLFAMTLS